MGFLPFVLVILASACSTQVPGEPSAVSPSVAGGAPVAASTHPPLPDDAWKKWIAEIRRALKELDSLHAAKDEKGAKEAWRRAYQDLFEKERSIHLAGRVPDTEITALEYAFGQLLVALDVPDRPGAVQALNRVRGRIDQIEA